MSKEHILVTGGAGFIGSHVAKHLLAQGYEVVVLDDLSGGQVDNVPSGAKFCEGSILDVPLLESLFAEHSFDYVYHLAAYAAEGLSHFIKNFNYSNNLIGSVNLINQAILHDVKCFVFTSSIAVYGEIPPPMRESDIPVPEDPYGVAKLAVEQELRVSCQQFGLPYVVFRPHNVYGEHQNLSDRYRNVIGIFMNQIMNDKPLSIFGDGLQSRAFSYIDDIMPPMIRAIKEPKAWGQVFNIGADLATTVKELAEVVKASMKGEQDILYLEARNEVLHAHADHSKVKEFFGEVPQTSLIEGIGQMAKWALNTTPGQPSYFGNIEIERGLPPFWVQK
ncbi:MAG: NAD-dependent epimerase/dehydratase family protein [Planctomycetes bacterium]|nr:NAD-dependent epimerase/dehydratase family protein [Planctomycetota bacterium]